MDGSLTLHFFSDGSVTEPGFTALATAVSGPEQVIEIGSGTDLTSRMPVYGYYDYGYSHSSLLSVADKHIKRHNRNRTMLKEHFR